MFESLLITIFELEQKSFVTGRDGSDSSLHTGGIHVEEIFMWNAVGSALVLHGNHEQSGEHQESLVKRTCLCLNVWMVEL